MSFTNIWIYQQRKVSFLFSYVLKVTLQKKKFVCMSWGLKTIKEILKFSFRAAQTPHCTDFKYNIYLKIYAIEKLHFQI